MALFLYISLIWFICGAGYVHHKYGKEIVENPEKFQREKIGLIIFCGGPMPIVIGLFADTLKLIFKLCQKKK